MASEMEIPGLAKYLPARPAKHKPGYCKQCGKKQDNYDQSVVERGFWQPSYCDACLNEDEDDDDE